MPAIIDSLREDHRTFKELLQALEEEVALFANAQRPDFEILEAIVSYFEGYPDCCHHPKEDAIFAKLKERDPAAAEQVGNLDEEHGASLRNLGRFTEAVENVLAEVDMPREAFGNVAMAFIENERHHIMMEEEKFFPVALEVLKDEDWAELDARLTDADNPLVPKQFEETFRTLQERVLKWEKEDQAGRAHLD